MIAVTFRPLPVWPHPETGRYARRSSSTFRATWSDTLDLLDRELRHLNASGVLIAAGFREQDLRIDGWPRADARAPGHPGVEVSFDTNRHGRLVYATDVCTRWEHNIRSIALGLEALRAVDRYGVTRRGEQYAGWRELTSEASMVVQVTSVSQARRILEEIAGSGLGVETATLVRLALKKAHPDAGGTADAVALVMRCREVLERRTA